MPAPCKGRRTVLDFYKVYSFTNEPILVRVAPFASIVSFSCPRKVRRPFETC